MSKELIKLILLVGLLLLCITFVSAETITQNADSLNFDSAKNITVTVNYNCVGSRQFNVSVPGGSGYQILFTSGACSNPSSTLTVCSFNGQQTGSYTIVHPNTSSLAYYAVDEFPSILSNYTNCSITNNVSLVKVPEDEIFYTLVEYGRGRGNYFYSTRGGTAGSGHTGTGCAYVPNGTMFELNFLHKIFNIKQYYDEADADAVNATFTCTYPNRTIVRTHLGTSIANNPTNTSISYFIDQIEGSWERMGYVGMQFDSTEQSVGENLTVYCENISYNLPTQQGDITVYTQGLSFDLQVRDPEPFVASASTTSTVGNGTQEVIITYNITNNELYTVDDVIIEIEAPPYAEFIGVRGELWGSALDQYRIEKISLAPGDSEIIDLVARFDTTSAPTLSSVNLTNGVKLKYVTCWDLNAYNPAESVQRIYDIGSASVNMSASTEVINIRERLQNIYNIVVFINETTIDINNTVNNIESIIIVINSTTIETNQIVTEINNTLTTISTNVDTTLTNTYNIINDTSYMKDLIDCDGSADTPMCTWLDDINLTIGNITAVLLEVNATINNLTVNVTVDLSGENISVNVTPDLTNVTLIIDDILSELNCTMNWTTEPNVSLCKTLDRIENNTLEINATVEEINNLINYFNATVFGNITLQELYDAIGNTTADTSELLTEIRRMREFDEELVFLVTDAFGLQESAKVELDGGNLGSAASKLREANNRLNEAADRLMDLQEEQGGVLADDGGPGFSWVLMIAAIIVIAALFFYFYSKPKSY